MLCARMKLVSDKYFKLALSLVGLLACWLAGSLGRRVIGLLALLACWLVGSLVCWLVGSLARWLVGSLARCSW